MAAGLTYTPITSTTLGSAASYIEFTSISGSYTDLILVINRGSTANDAGGTLQFNSDTGSNYSSTYLQGNGSTARSGREGVHTYINTGSYITTGTSITTNTIVHLQNYSNTTTYKTVLYRTNNAGTGATYLGTEAGVGLWRSTSAITSVKYNCDGSTFLSGTTATLYGIL